MKTKLSLSGNVWYIYLSKSMLQLLRLDPGKSKVLFKIKNKSLYITKISNEIIEKLENPLTKNILKKGGGHIISLTLPILKLIDVDPENDEVDITIEEETLIIKKALP